MTEALVLIDLMPRIVALPVAPHTGEQVLARSKQLAAAYRATGRPVVAVRVERPNVAEQPPGSELADGVAEPDDVIVVKRSIGGFHQTDLDLQLQARGVTSLTLTGLVTNLGVESTARAASDHDYQLTFVSDAMSALTAEEHDFAVTKVFPRFGAVLTTDEVLAKLS
jgi:nicotinamidase-related amidase